MKVVGESCVMVTEELIRFEPPLSVRVRFCGREGGRVDRLGECHVDRVDRAALRAGDRRQRS